MEISLSSDFASKRQNKTFPSFLILGGIRVRQPRHGNEHVFILCRWGATCNDGRGNGVNTSSLGLGGALAACGTAAASMNNVNPSSVMEAENMRQRQRWTRRWYLLVIVLLYIGLFASFSLNVSLLLRKPASSSSLSASSSSSLSSSLTSSDGTGEHTNGIDSTFTNGEDGSISGQFQQLKIY